MTDRRVVSAFEPCGCIAGVHVLDDHPADAWKFAAEEAKAGLRIEVMEIEAWRALNGGRFFCSDHVPNGPPWWKSNGGKGKRPTDYEQPGMGL